MKTITNDAVVERLVAQVVSGDPEAVRQLWEQCEPDLTRIVTSTLRSWGRRDLLQDRDELGGVILDAFFAVVDRAGGWLPGGAPPWVWAQAAVRASVAVSAGHQRAGGDPDDLFASLPAAEEDLSPSEARVGGGGVHADLERLRSTHPVVELLLDAATRVGSSRDLHVHLDYRYQKRTGDPSPANTVAELHGLTPATVRQIDRRMRVKLGDLAESEAQYAPILHLPWLAA